MRLRPLLLLVSTLAGCSLIGPQPAEDVPVEVTEPEPEPEPAPAPVVDVPEPAPEPPPEPEPEPLPAPPTSFEPPVAVVMSSRAPAYEQVALALSERLSNTEVYDLSDRSLLPREAFERIAESDARVVVAIGLRAALYAKDHARVPVVFSQVFNIAENGLVGDSLRGVAVLPPLGKQLDAWREHSPDLSSIGAIVGAGHGALLDEARSAAESRGLEFHYRIAASDRETLYVFNRLVPEIDAFWLFPDNRVLSAGVLREMLSNAARHRVEIAVFNDALLELDPTVSTTSDEDDVAYVIMRILKRIDAGEIDAVPALTPLNDVRTTTGARKQSALIGRNPREGGTS